MQRIDTSTRAIDLFGPGKHGFKNGDLAFGIAPTDFNAAFCNAVQEELANVVEDMGAVLDPTSRTQVRDALRGRLIFVQAFLVAGSFVYTPSVGTKQIRALVRGAGGAGGGSAVTAAGQISFGSGGGAGAYCEGIYTSLFSGATVTVGAAGARALGAAGGAGGASSLGALLSAQGGNGGNMFGPTAAPLTAGLNNAASASGGYLRVPGKNGGTGLMVSSTVGLSGTGGESEWGAGGGTQNSSGDGADGKGYGAGGSGGMSQPSSAARYGGNGTPGCVIIMEYA